MNILTKESIFRTYPKSIPKFQIQNINRIKWLPLSSDSKLTSDFAYLVGKIIGDGHLSKNFISSFFGQEDEIKLLSSFIYKKFYISNLKIKKKTYSLGSCYGLYINNSLFGRILYSLGSPKGNKTTQKFLIPHWIRKNKENSRRFLQGLLEDELTTIKIESKNHVVNLKFKMAKQKNLLFNLNDFLNQVKTLIELFGIKCGKISEISFNKKNQQTKELYFSIYRNRENILKFQNEIGFRFNTQKIINLNESCEVLRKSYYFWTPRLNFNKVYLLNKNGLSIRMIAERINSSKSTIHRILKHK